MEENVQAIKRWERAILLARSKAEQVGDWIARTAGSGPDLMKKTDLRRLTNRMEELAEPATATAASPTEAGRPQ
jgi:hypothetical protein